MGSLDLAVHSLRELAGDATFPLPKQVTAHLIGNYWPGAEVTFRGAASGLIGCLHLHLEHSGVQTFEIAVARVLLDNCLLA